MPPRRTLQHAEIEDLQQEIVRLKRRLSRLERRKGLSSLARDFAVRPQGKSAPMETYRSSIQADSLRADDIEDISDNQNPSSYEDIFEGSPRKPSSSSIEFIFKEIEDPLPKSSSLPIFDEPVYDMYDDDMIGEVIDLDHSAHDDDESKKDAQSELFLHKALHVHAFTESNTLSYGNQKLGSGEKTCSRVQCNLCSGVTRAFHKSTNREWVHAFCVEGLLESSYKRFGMCLKCSYGHGQAKSEGLKNIKQLKVDLCRRLQPMLKSLLYGENDTGWKYPDRFSQPKPPPSCGHPDIFL